MLVMHFASLARGIDDVATMYKYNIILANSDGDDQKEVTVLNNLLAASRWDYLYGSSHYR